MTINSKRTAILASAAVTALSVVASLLVTYFLAEGDSFKRGVIPATIVPLTVAPLACAWSFSQTLRIHRLNRRLEFLLNHDTLTQLHSRAFFFDKTTSDTGFSVAVTLMVDADHFKSINDTHGHDVGDMALCHIAGVLRENCRQDDIVARLGGEEFVVYMRNANVELGSSVAERIRNALEQTPLLAGDARINLTVSIGLATRIPSADIDAVLKKADEALYAAKASGRNRVVIADEIATRH